MIVAVGSIVLLVSLFPEWYGERNAWEAFEVTDVLIAAAAVAALAAAVGLIAPELAYADRRWLPAAALAAAVLVTAQILSPPPTAEESDVGPGAWLAFAAALAMLIGAVLSLGRISFSVAVEGREPRQRVAAVDHRPPTTETGATVARPSDTTSATEPLADTGAEPGTETRRGRER